MSNKHINRYNTILWVLMFPALLALMYGIYQLDHYTSWLFYALTLITIGSIIGIAISNIVAKKLNNSLTNKERKRISRENIRTKIFILSLFLTFGFGSLIGELNKTIVENQQFKVVEKGMSGLSKNRQYYLFINYKGEKKRYSFGKSVYDLYMPGDSIKIAIKNNFYGFELLEPAARH
jgi:hypothetical protein